MNLAWKEMKKTKSKFFIFGMIMLLISFLTFMIAGLASGLSQDNASFIRELPNGSFYMTTEAEGNYTLSNITLDEQQAYTDTMPNMTALSIQMGTVHNDKEEQQSVAFVKTTASNLFPQLNENEIIVDQSLQQEGIEIGDYLTNTQFDGKWKVVGFSAEAKFNHAPVAFIHPTVFNDMYRTTNAQLLFMPTDVETPIDGFAMYTKKAFLNTIPSYQAEQLSLNMIVGFLIIISGMLFAIFFYMMNAQKVGLYGVLKAIGVKTSTLFVMMWTQMLTISFMALAVSLGVSQLFERFAPEAMPFHLTWTSSLLLAGVFLVIGFIGATLSGVQIKKIAPLQAIQQGEM